MDPRLIHIPYNSPKRLGHGVYCVWELFCCWGKVDFIYIALIDIGRRALGNTESNQHTCVGIRNWKFAEIHVRRKAETDKGRAGHDRRTVQGRSFGTSGTEHCNLRTAHCPCLSGPGQLNALVSMRNAPRSNKKVAFLADEACPAHGAIKQKNS